MTKTMVGELARLFAAEARDTRHAAGVTAIERAHIPHDRPSSTVYNSSHRLEQIAKELQARQAAMGLIDSIGSLGTPTAGLSGTQPVQSTAQGVASSLPTPNVSIPGVISNVRDQLQTGVQTASGAGQSAGQQAQQAGAQAQQASGTLSTVILAAAVGLGLVLVLTRR